MKTPLTNRGVKTPIASQWNDPAVSIDWLQYSVPWPDGIHEWPDHGFMESELLKKALPPHDKLVLTGDILMPLRGYDNGMSGSFGRVFWHSKNRMQHIGVIFTGDDMRAAVNVLLPHTQMLSWVLAKAKKIARMDVAVDIFDPRADPVDILRLWKMGHVGTRARTVTETTSYTTSPAGEVVPASTVYVGKRDGERMLRVYDKGIQTGSDKPWVRAELQARDDYALALARAIQAGGLSNAGRSAIRAYCNVPKLTWWQLAMEGPATDIPYAQNHEGNTEKWIMTVALPAIRREAERQLAIGVPTVYNGVERVLRQLKGEIKE
jgi:hypothetical protein